MNLDPELVRRVKHHAIDRQLSVSELVGRILQDRLEREASMTADEGNHHVLSLQPMVHVEHMDATVSFYEALGGAVLHGSRDGDFVMIRIGGAQISLLAHPPNPAQNEGTVELNFETKEQLDVLEERLRRAGVIIAQRTTDEGFGRQLQVSTPDGLLIKINELDPRLYT